jgi:hypothetical protein
MCDASRRPLFEVLHLDTLTVLDRTDHDGAGLT